MNETIETILKHRSIRKFKPQKIERSVLETLITCGQMASTSSYIQATSVIRVASDTNRVALSKISGGQKQVVAAAEFLVFCADLHRNIKRIEKVGGQADFSWAEQFLAASVDVALFAQNVAIAAESEGLGVCYIGGIRNNPDSVCEILNLPDLVYPVFGLCLGCPDQHPEIKPRLPLQTVLHENSYPQGEEIDAHIEAYDKQIKEYYIARTSGKLDFTWSEQMKKQAETQSRPFMKKFLKNKGFNIK